jgi:hypothetical protein
VPRLAPIVILAVPAGVVGLAQACGASVQSINEGNVRFEHCYRLDLDRNIAPSHRLGCWKQWTETFAYGQTRDRVEHARERIRHLSAGETSPPGLNLEGAKNGDAAPADPAEAPAPTSLHAPPPPTAPAPEPTAEEDAGPEADSVPKPEAECAADCDDDWQACRRDCSGETSGGGDLCDQCEPDYRACMAGCFGSAPD